MKRNPKDVFTPLVKKSKRKVDPWTAYAVKNGVIYDVLCYCELKKEAVSEAKTFCDIENKHGRQKS